jgi:type IV secretory pathway VirB10-like protein
MLNEFVEKIFVHEADKSSGERVQQVDIYLNFIGRFDVPEEEIPPTPEELEAQEKRRKKMVQRSEANKRWYAKKKLEMERQRLLEAGELPPPTPEEIEAAVLAEEAEEQAKLKRKEEKLEYKRNWARQKRERLKAEKSAEKSEEDNETA